MKLTDWQISDLGQLAIGRCERSLQSVTQLVDNGPQAYAVVLAVACSLIDDAADMLQQGMEQQNGVRPSDEAAMGRVIADILDAKGVQWRRSKSRTPSAEK